MYDGDESEGPKGTFEIYKAEADSLFKQGEYKKSIDSYTIALELQPGDKNTLVCRSKCYLQLGDTENALADSESSLAEDKTFHKGVYQKAQALYYQGDFELALVFYHRGHKLRPELQEFRLGIQKAQEAIDNSVGAPEKVKLTTEGDLSFFAKQDEKKIKKPAYNTYGRPGMQTQKKLEVSRPAGNEKTIKQLLGELYGDRQYLEKLLKETDPNTPVGKTISGLVSQGLNYLDTRTDFWRQQKPMYARKHEKQMMKRENRSEGSNTAKLSPNDYIIRELERIDQAQVEGKYSESLKRAQRCLNTVNGFTEDIVPNKMEVIANLHSCIGNAHLELGSYDKAQEQHQIDYNLGEEHDMEEACSRGLDNLGRVYARKGDYSQAITVWEKKLPLSKSALESTWLYHEIGRCYLEMGKYQTAKEHGEKSLTLAEEAGEPQWQLQASVLVAQSELKLGDLSAALSSFELSLDLARTQGDTSAESAIKKAIDDVNNKIAKGSSTSVKPAEGETNTSNNNNAASPTNNKDNKDNASVKSKPASATEQKESPKSAKSVAKSVTKSEAKSETKPADNKSEGSPAQEDTVADEDNEVNKSQEQEKEGTT